jgi:hypothetical protein
VRHSGSRRRLLSLTLAAAAVAGLSAPLQAADYEGGVHAVSARAGATTVTLRYRHFKPQLTDGAIFQTDEMSLTVARSGGPSKRYDARALELVEPTVFPNPGEPSCGAGAPLTIVRHYAVLEGIQVGKGCRNYAQVVDLERPGGEVLHSFMIDHIAAHPDVPHPPTFTPQRFVRVTSVERFAIPADRIHPGGVWPWIIAVVHGFDRLCVPAVLVIERPSVAEFPRAGHEIAIGRLEPDAFGQHGTVVRLSAVDERAYANAQPPLSPALLRSLRYNAWFSVSRRYAQDGRFADAADAFANALQYLDDADLRVAETRTLAHYRAIVAKLRAGTMTPAQARREWFYPS